MDLEEYRREIEMCYWKKMEKNRNSTTFMDVRRNKNHPLYKCITCDGFNMYCRGYRSKLYYMNKKKTNEDELIKHYISEYL